jgi:hypothetical protein
VDLIYTDADGTEIGILTGFALDYEASTTAGENTFEIKCALATGALEIGSIFYAENSEIGGIVDAIKIDTAKQIIYYTGRTWRGMLESKILRPDDSEDYYIVSGDANAILTEIISRVGLEDMFSVDTSEVETISSYQFERYVDAYTGIIKMLSAYGLKLSINYDGTVNLAAVAIVDYSTEQDMTDENFDFVIEKKNAECNHLIALGSGELSERIVVDLYLDAEGNISTTQTYTGVDEIVKIYDYSNAESEDDLTEKATDKLAEYAIENSIDVSSYDLSADLGDKFLAEDTTTGISAEEYIVRKISTLDSNGTLKTSYEVGETIL